MSEIIERVARAISLHEGRMLLQWGPEMRDYQGAARAAIEAMREPTDEMIGEGRLMLLAGQGMVEQTLEGDAKWVWIEMIDTALGKVDA